MSHERTHTTGNCRTLCCGDWRCPCETEQLSENGWVISASDLDRLEAKRFITEGGPELLPPDVIHDFIAQVRLYHAQHYNPGWRRALDAREGR